MLRRSNPPPGSEDRRLWLLKPMQVSNWRFAVYLLILSGFWTAFNQILGGVPLVGYIRDFVQTKPLLDFLAAVLGGLGLSGWSQGITDYVAAGGQFNPEWISNLDPLFIVICQIAVSLTVAKMGRFPGMITGHRDRRHRHLAAGAQRRRDGGCAPRFGVAGGAGGVHLRRSVR